MSPVQQAIKARNKKFVIAGGVLFGGLWLFLVFYLLSGGDKVPVENQPGAVAVSAVSPVAANPYTPAVPTSYHSPVNILHHPGASASMKPSKCTLHVVVFLFLFSSRCQFGISDQQSYGALHRRWRRFDRRPSG